MEQRGCRGDTHLKLERRRLYRNNLLMRTFFKDTEHFYLAVLSSLFLSATNQVVGTERRLQPARLRKNIRNLTGLESSDMMT